MKTLIVELGMNDASVSFSRTFDGRASIGHVRTTLPCLEYDFSLVLQCLRIIENISRDHILKAMNYIDEVDKKTDEVEPDARRIEFDKFLNLVVDGPEE